MSAAIVLVFALVGLVLIVLVVVAVVVLVIGASRKQTPPPLPQSDPEVDTSAERKRILGMLEEGKIDADEADRLLAALNGPEGE